MKKKSVRKKATVVCRLSWLRRKSKSDADFFEGLNRFMAGEGFDGFVVVAKRRGQYADQINGTHRGDYLELIGLLDVARSTIDRSADKNGAGSWA